MRFLRENARERNKDKTSPVGTPIAWRSGDILRVSKSIYEGEIQDAFPGFDTARFLKRSPSGLLFRNGNVDIATGIRYDNSIVVGNVRAITSVTKGRWVKGPPEVIGMVWILKNG